MLKFQSVILRGLPGPCVPMLQNYWMRPIHGSCLGVCFARAAVGRFGCMVEGMLGDHVLRYRQTASGRQLKSDGETVGKTADYLSMSGLVVWMGNEDLQLARGRGEGRRRYLDFIASQLFEKQL